MKREEKGLGGQRRGEINLRGGEASREWVANSC